MHAAIGLTEKEADPGGLQGVRLHHQGNLPGFREISLVDLQIGIGQEDFTTGVGVIPSHGPRPTGVVGVSRTATS